MSRSTEAAAVAECVGLLGSLSGASVSGITVYERARKSLAQPWAVAVSTTGRTPEDWLLAISVYGVVNDDKTAQDELTAIVSAIEAALNNGGYPLSDWDYRYDQELERLVADTVIRVGREDW